VEYNVYNENYNGGIMEEKSKVEAVKDALNRNKTRIAYYGAGFVVGAFAAKKHSRSNGVALAKAVVRAIETTGEYVEEIGEYTARIVKTAK
jgi:hypothetical protein